MVDEEEKIEPQKAIEKRKGGAWENLPLSWKFGIGVLIFILISGRQAGAGLQSNLWVLILFGALAFMKGSDIVKEKRILTEEEVKNLVELFLERKKLQGRELPRNIRYKIDINCNLKRHNLLPMYYITGVTLKYPDSRVEYKWIYVDAYDGNPKIVDALSGKVTGHEVQPSTTVETQFLKYLKSYPQFSKFVGKEK